MGIKTINATMFRHTKVAFCSLLKIEEICRGVYDLNQKCLVVLEKATSNPHLHFQGYSTLDEKTFKNRFSDVTCNHYMKRLGDKKRPVRHSNKEVNELGFQYMCKEGEVVFRQGFSDEDIESLREASKLYVEEVKNGLKRKLHEMEFRYQDPEDLHHQYRRCAMKYYNEQDPPKMPPPNLQKLLIWHMSTGYPKDDTIQNYCAVRI